MERFLLKKLIEWKESKKRKPLLLEGARQVGKTWLTKEFGRQCYKEVVYINFDREKSLHTVLEASLSPDVIIRALSALTGHKISADERQSTSIEFMLPTKILCMNME